MSFAQLKAASKDLLGTADLLDFSIAICAEGMVGYSPEVEDHLRGGISAEIAAKIIEITFGEGENVEDFPKPRRAATNCFINCRIQIGRWHLRKPNTAPARICDARVALEDRKRNSVGRI